MTGRPAGIPQGSHRPASAGRCPVGAELYLLESKQLSRSPHTVCRAEGPGPAQLADGVQLLEPGRPGQCGHHAAVPGGPVLCPDRHAGPATSGDAQHRCGNGLLRGH